MMATIQITLTGTARMCSAIMAASPNMLVTNSMRMPPRVTMQAAMICPRSLSFAGISVTSSTMPTKISMVAPRKKAISDWENG